MVHRVMAAITALVLGARCAEVLATEQALRLDEIRSLSGQGSIVESVAFSPDGKRLASATDVPDSACFNANALCSSVKFFFPIEKPTLSGDAKVKKNEHP